MVQCIVQGHQKTGDLGLRRPGFSHHVGEAQTLRCCLDLNFEFNFNSTQTKYNAISLVSADTRTTSTAHTHTNNNIKT